MTTLIPVRVGARRTIVPGALTFALLFAAATIAQEGKPVDGTKPTEKASALCGEKSPGYTATEKPAVVEIAAASYLAVSGKGAPGGEVFQKKIGALFMVAGRLKMKCSLAGLEFPTCPLEGLWWGPGGKPVVTDEAPESLDWKLLIRVPEFITQEDVDGALGPLASADGESNAPEVTLERLEEGRCVQALHIGPYTEEGKTIAAMLAFAKEKGLTPHGRHHEIYVSDPNTATPDKIRTILRQPVK